MQQHLDYKPDFAAFAQKVETWVVAFVLFMLSGALIAPLLDPNQVGGDDSPVLRLLWLPVYGLILGLAIFRFKALARFWFPISLCVVLIGWVFASSSWSLDPGVTERRAVAVAFTTLFGLYLAATFDGRRMAEVVAGLFMVLAVLSLVVAVAYPKMGVHQDINAGDWRGVWYEKNQMGAMMVYGALAACAALLSGSRHKTLWIIAILLTGGMILMSKSKTALICLMIALVAPCMLALLRRGPVTAVAIVWTGGVAAAFGALVAALGPELFFKALGKDPSFTGRTDIWAAVLEQSAKRPMTGYGYAAFWSKTSLPAEWIRHDTQWDVPTAHNGWLDTLAQIGWVGVGLCVLILGLALLAATFRFRRVADGYFATALLVIFLLMACSESVILERNSMAWMFACAAITRLLGPAPKQEQEQAAAPIPFVSPAKTEWRLAASGPEIEVWEPAPTFGRRQGSPFGARMATGAA